jgi:hypothetical protein
VTICRIAVEFFCTMTPCLHRLRQLRQRARHAVLYQDLRGVEVDADLERDRQ